MIRFNQRIILEQSANENWILNTDRGDRYMLHQMQQNINRTLITDWVNLNDVSEFRRWQTDLFVKELTRLGTGDDFILFVPYKKGGGLQQPHDIVIMYHKKHKMWVLSTSEYHWFQFDSFRATTFHRDQAVKIDILDFNDRKTKLYPILDEFNRQYRTIETRLKIKEAAE